MTVGLDEVKLAAHWLKHGRLEVFNDRLANRVGEWLEENLARLTPPTPEDVARDYDDVLDFIANGRTARKGLVEVGEAMRRLRDAAARAKALEVDCRNLASAVRKEQQRALTSESERDAARRDAAEAQEMLGQERRRVEEARQEADRLVKEHRVEMRQMMEQVGEATRGHEAMMAERNEYATETIALRAKVAELERERNAALSMLADEEHAYGEMEARAQAADRRVAELEAKLKGTEEALDETHEEWKRLSTHPAPAGLLEAVGAATRAWERMGTAKTGDAAQAFMAMDMAMRALAAYDAAKGGEPTVTHAALAAVVETFINEHGLASETLMRVGAREVLRRVTGGEAQAAGGEQADARKYREACERARDERGLLQAHVQPAPHPSAALWNVAVWLLALDTPPSGPGGEPNPPESPDGSTEPTPTPDVPPLAQPEPAAPEVMWEGDGVRVLEDGTAQKSDHHGGWEADPNPRVQVLARALAEAKRELAGSVNPIALAAVRKTAAEDMRERAARAIAQEAADTHNDAARPLLDECEVIIRALPLE